MDVSNKYSIYFGTVRGVIGNTSCEPGKQPKYEIFDKTEKAGVTCLEWGRNLEEIIIGQNNGCVSLFDASSLQTVKKIEIEGKGEIIGAAPVEDNIIIARKTGQISVWNEQDIEYFSGDLSNEGTLNAIAHNKSQSNIIATGGERNDLKLYDIDTKKAVFRAKSMGHDNLNLPIPTSIRGIVFVDEKLPVCCTKEGHVLLYDQRVQRRPITKFIEPKASYTTIASAFDGRKCFVGTTRGYMQFLDLRSAKCLKTFKTFTGSVSCINYDPTASVVATVSLDRYLRVHDVESKQLLHKEYLKLGLTKVLLKPIIKEEKAQDNQMEKSNECTDEEYEQIFEDMETIGEEDARITRKRTLVKNVMAEQKKKSKKKKVVHL